MFGDEDIDLENDERSEAFHSWDPRAGEVPANIRGSVTARIEDESTIKILESDDHPLGEGTIVQRVKRLALRKSPYYQLQGRSNPVLALSLWHSWGIGAKECNAVNASQGHGQSSGHLYAAAVGDKGDPLYERYINDFLPADEQTAAGHLVRTNHLGGLLYLFFDGTAAFFTNERAGAPTLDSEAIDAITQAFGLLAVNSERGRWSLLVA